MVTNWGIMAVRVQIDQFKPREVTLERIESMKTCFSTYMLIQSYLDQSTMLSFRHSMVTNWGIMAVRVQIDQFKLREFNLEDT